MVLPKEVGNAGEALARQYLEKQGLRFLDANWSCKTGEIDLIMQDPDGTRVMVEVRLRRPTSFGEGLDTMANIKKKKLIRTAKYYQQKENYWGDIRFDVVSIIMHPNQDADIEHIPHAFGA